MDCSNTELRTLINHWVAEALSVSEEFLGLHSMSSIDAQSIVHVMKDTLLRLQIQLSKLRRQCYDGYSTKAGPKGVVASKIAELEPIALFTPCLGHAMNLAVGGVGKRSPVKKDCQDCCYEVVKLVRFSPKRKTMQKGLTLFVPPHLNPSIPSKRLVVWSCCFLTFLSMFFHLENSVPPISRHVCCHDNRATFG